MNLSYRRLLQIFKRFNKYGFTWEDVLKICKRYRINIEFVPMHENIRGYYSTTLKNKYRKKYIVLNTKLSEIEKLFVALHELVHHFLHVSADRKQQTFFCRAAELIESREETQAYMFALMMLIPQNELLEMAKENFENISPEKQDYYLQRKFIYEKYKSVECAGLEN